MQGYVPAQDEAFGDSRKCFGELEDWLASEDAAGLQHADLEEQLGVRGRELLRQLFQDRLDLTAAREERRRDVAGEDGVVRTRAERGRERPLVTRFGQVTVSRIAYRSPGRRNVHLLDAAQNLPEEKHSHGLRRLIAAGAAGGSIDAACAAVTRATGVRIGKRQAEELVRRAAADVDAFYRWRAAGPAPDEQALVLTFDGKGIVMLPGALRPATARAAASAEGRGRDPPPRHRLRLLPGRACRRRRMRPLPGQQEGLPGLRHRAGQGLAHRHGDNRRRGQMVKDRMDITGARWGLEGAEAVLKLRALIATSDFDAYWRFHLRREHERIHHATYRDSYVIAA